MKAGPTRGGPPLVVLAAVLSLSPALAAQPYSDAAVYQEALEARVWLDRGAEPVLERGEQVRLYYRTSSDAFVSIFQIDTNGSVRMVFPRSPDENYFVRGGRDYRLLFPRSPYWEVGDDPGVGYFFVVASPEPLDFASFGYSHFDRGWDLSPVGRQVYRDPYVAMDEYVAALIPDWEYVGYALDFVSYHVSARYDYPRFLCYDCHGFRPYYAWNPYHYACSSFRVVIFSDPYYYPQTRYRGTRVVYARPPRPLEPRFAFKERAVGEASLPLFRQRPSVAGTTRSSEAQRRSGSGIGSGGTASPATAAPRENPDATPLEPRRRTGGSGDPVSPGSILPGERRGGELTAPRRDPLDPPATLTPREETPGRVDADAERARPVLQRRPSSPPLDVQERRDPPPEVRPSRESAPVGGGAAPPSRRPPPVSSPGSDEPARARQPSSVRGAGESRMSPAARQGAVPLVESAGPSRRLLSLVEAGLGTSRDRDAPAAGGAAAAARVVTPSVDPSAGGPAHSRFSRPARPVSRVQGSSSPEGRALPAGARGTDGGGTTEGSFRRGIRGDARSSPAAARTQRPSAVAGTALRSGAEGRSAGRGTSGAPTVARAAPERGSEPSHPATAARPRSTPPAPTGRVTRVPTADGGSRPVLRRMPGVR